MILCAEMSVVTEKRSFFDVKFWDVVQVGAMVYGGAYQRRIESDVNYPRRSESTWRAE